jgi:uncharacterized damage-inducible protein DinB
MHDDFVSLYTYNRWADRRVLDACRKLTPEQYVAEPAPGWSSVRSTIVHLAIVTEGWLRGLAGESQGSVPTEAELPTVDAAERLLDEAYRIFEGLVPTLTPEWLATLRTLTRGARSAILPPWAVLRHLVNHATYHRGQVASKLKRFGVEQPATDFIYWVFEQHAPKA